MDNQASCPPNAAEAATCASRVWVRAPYGQTPRQQLAELWRRRELAGFLLSYSLSQIYSNALLGLAWLFIRPAIMVGTAFFVVGKVLGVNTAPVPLLLFMLVSFAPWLFFQRGLLLCTNGFGMYSTLLKSFLFPRTMAQLASVAPSFLIFLFIFLISLAAITYFAIAGIYTPSFGWHILWVPVAVLMMAVLIWGITFFTAPLNSMARDVRLTLRYALTALMVVSPVFYPISHLNESVRSYMWYNPLACTLELYRWGLFHQNEPIWWHIFLSWGVIGGIFVSGWFFFALLERKAVEAM